MNAPHPDEETLADMIGLSLAGEPARLVCCEVDYGRGWMCQVEFAGRRFGAAEISVRRARHTKREIDLMRLRNVVWFKFWRYIGAA